MQKSIYHIEKMDCPSEEQLIRMKLEPMEGIQSLVFDLPGRTLEVYHTADADAILSALETLQLQSTRVGTEEAGSLVRENETLQRRLLWAVLMINFAFFVLEIVSGFISQSMGLVADSLDMLADAAVYGLSLVAVGQSIRLKKRVAKMAGYLQLVLAVLGFVEVVRRFIGTETMPAFETMIAVSVLALIANSLCLYLLQKGKSNEAHIRASLIFTSNDVIINGGVIVAGLLVHWLQSGYPDLIVGAVVFIIVASGAYRILQLAK
jgi:Co/Zn/Cd efflux system component